MEVKMEVPSEVLEELVCEKCSGYLSRGPVHIIDIDKYRCGRCLPSEEEDGTRNSAYEELAELMSFPCSYRENGCATMVPFIDNELHEVCCPARVRPDEQRTCVYSTRGCTYSDIIAKCQKHQSFYCRYRTHRFMCYMCLEYTTTGTTLDQHYTQAHGDMTHRAGTVCTVSPTNRPQGLIVDCDFGRAVCMYLVTSSDFVLFVRTALPSTQLYKYRCAVELSHPTTGHALTHTAEVQYSRDDDWIAFIPVYGPDDYYTFVHDNKVNVKINITKTIA